MFHKVDFVTVLDCRSLQVQCGGCGPVCRMRRTPSDVYAALRSRQRQAESSVSSLPGDATILSTYSDSFARPPAPPPTLLSPFFHTSAVAPDSLTFSPLAALAEYFCCEHCKFSVSFLCKMKGRVVEGGRGGRGQARKTRRLPRWRGQ